MTAAWPTDEEVVQNAKAAYSEVRAQIDHQIRNADAIDTKATAVITAVGVLAALVAPRFHLDAAIRQGSGAFALLIGFVALGCCFLAIRPQADFAFGADPADLTELGGKEEAALCARTDDGYRRVLVAADIALLASSRRLGPAIPSRHLRLLADALLRLRGSASGGNPVLRLPRLLGRLARSQEHPRVIRRSRIGAVPSGRQPTTEPICAI